jgi:hypothetical protein
LVVSFWGLFLFLLWDLWGLGEFSSLRHFVDVDSGQGVCERSHFYVEGLANASSHALEGSLLAGSDLWLSNAHEDWLEKPDELYDTEASRHFDPGLNVFQRVARLSDFIENFGTEPVAKLEAAAL